MHLLNAKSQTIILLLQTQIWVRCSRCDEPIVARGGLRIVLRCASSLIVAVKSGIGYCCGRFDWKTLSDFCLSLWTFLSRPAPSLLKQWHYDSRERLLALYPWMSRIWLTHNVLALPMTTVLHLTILKLGSLSVSNGTEESVRHGKCSTGKLFENFGCR